MKHILITTVLVMFCITSSLNAANPYQLLCNNVVRFGQILDRVDNVPLVGKFTNLLPVAMISAGFQKCPGQTIIILAGLLGYALTYHGSVRSLLEEYKVIDVKQENNEVRAIEIDESLFVFDGEDEDDAQESDFEYTLNNKQSAQQPSFNFL